jgi:uncharacterized protein
MANKSSSNKNRGFASMDETKQREIASKGGKASGGNKRGSSQSNQSAGNSSSS